MESYSTNQWYSHVWVYSDIYIAQDDDGISHYFNKQGDLLTSSYSRGDCVLSQFNLKCIPWEIQPILDDDGNPTDKQHERTVMCEFTTHGLIYGIGNYIRHSTSLTSCSYDYIFVPYDEE